MRKCARSHRTIYKYYDIALLFAHFYYTPFHFYFFFRERVYVDDNSVVPLRACLFCRSKRCLISSFVFPFGKRRIPKHFWYTLFFLLLLLTFVLFVSVVFFYLCICVRCLLLGSVHLIVFEIDSIPHRQSASFTHSFFFFMCKCINTCAYVLKMCFIFLLFIIY